MEQLARYTAAPMDEIERAATAMVKSKFFQDSADVNQAIVKIMAGQEIGIGPFASMNGIHVIQGKPTYGANILAAKIKGSGKYDYRVVEISEKVCSIDFTQGGAKIGNSTFTIEDARKSGTKNVDKFPRNMLFARAMSNGIKWFCPDVLQGVTAYVPEEFGAVVNDDGVIVVDGTIKQNAAAMDRVLEKEQETKWDGEPSAAEAAYLNACEVTSSDNVRYGDRPDSELFFVAKAKTQPEKAAAAKIILDWRKTHNISK